MPWSSQVLLRWVAMQVTWSQPDMSGMQLFNVTVIYWQLDMVPVLYSFHELFFISLNINKCIHDSMLKLCTLFTLLVWGSFRPKDTKVTTQNQSFHSHSVVLVKGILKMSAWKFLEVENKEEVALNNYMTGLVYQLKPLPSCPLLCPLSLITRYP